MIMLISWLCIPSSIPRPTPARALWPKASEKNAMRRFTAMVPSSASSGVKSKMASRPRFIKSSSKHSKGRSVFITLYRVGKTSPRFHFQCIIFISGDSSRSAFFGFTCTG